jgi:molybdopterin biosynthesis enzyme
VTPPVLGTGAAAAIMTGAPMPAGADCVVPVEDTIRLDDGRRVRIGHASSPGRYIAGRGSDCAAGRVVLTRSTKLTPAAIAVAASVGAHTVDVFPRPTCIVLSTGDEIVPLDAAPGPTQIRNSNSAMLVALLNRLGGDARDGGIVADEPRRIRATIQAALRHARHRLHHRRDEHGGIRFRPAGAERNRRGFENHQAPHQAGQTVRLRLDQAAIRLRPAGQSVSGFACTLRLCSRLIARLAGGNASDAERWIHAPLAEHFPPTGRASFINRHCCARMGKSCRWVEELGRHLHARRRKRAVGPA